MEQVYLLRIDGGTWTFSIKLCPEYRIEVQGEPSWQQIFFTYVLSSKLANKKQSERQVKQAVKEVLEYMGAEAPLAEGEINAIVKQVLGGGGE